jgi:hypothetical protein
MKNPLYNVREAIRQGICEFSCWKFSLGRILAEYAKTPAVEK